MSDVGGGPSGLFINPYRFGGVALPSDDFNRANAGSLGTSSSGHAWTSHGASPFTIVTNQAAPPAVAGYNTDSLDAGVLVCTVEVSYIPPAAATIDSGPSGRVVDNNSYVFVDIAKQTTNIVSRTFSKVAGVNLGSGVGAFHPLTSLITVSNNFTDTVLVRLQFTSASAGEVFANSPFLGGVWTSLGTFSGLHANLQTPTRYGLAGNNSGGKFDNLVIT